MKKFVSLLLVGIISVTSFASWVSASSNNPKYSNLTIEYREKIKNSSQNSVWYETRWFKGKVSKEVLETVWNYLIRVKYHDIKGIMFNSTWWADRIFHMTQKAWYAIRGAAGTIETAGLNLREAIKTILVEQANFSPYYAWLIATFVETALF